MVMFIYHRDCKNISVFFFYKTQKGIDGTDAKAGTQFLKLEDSF